MESPTVIAETIVAATAETFPLKKDDRLDKVERNVKSTKIEEKKIPKIADVTLTKKIVEAPKKSKRDRRDESSDSDDSDDGEFIYFLFFKKKIQLVSRVFF